MFYRKNKRLSLLSLLFLLLTSGSVFGQQKDQLNRLVSINFGPDSLIKSLRKLEVQAQFSDAEPGVTKR